MKARMFVGGLLAVFCVIGAQTGAGEKNDPADFIEKPGPEHKFLAGLVGTYDADVTLYLPPKGEASKSKGVMKRSMILGDRFVREEFQGEFAGESFKGIGTVGYDIGRKKFITSWVDNVSTSIMMSFGTYDKESKTFTYFGDFLEGENKMKNKDVLRIVSADEQRFEMYKRAEGEKKFFKVMEITYTRKK